MRLILGIILFVFLSSISVRPQSGGGSGSAYEGKHFLFGFMQNEIDNTDPLTLQVYIVSSYPSEIIVNIPGENPKYYSLKPDSIQRIDIKSSFEIREVEQRVQKSIEIISNVPVLVYTFNSRNRTSDCFTAVPVTQWGNEYVVMSFPNDQYWSNYQRVPYDDYLIPRKSEFLVLANEDDTEVTIIPKAMTNSKRSQNVPFKIILNKGDCYLVQSYDYQIGQGDLTGSIVRSTKPIGVISGHVRTAVPQFMDWISESKDHLAVMLTPTSAWARQFYSVPYKMHEGGDLFRITNIMDSTLVIVESIDTSYSLFLDKAGTYVTIPAVKNATRWTSNHPVQIGQYMMRIGGEEDNSYYDPCLVVLPPAEQFVSKMIFQTIGNEAKNPEQYLGFGIYLIVEEEALASLSIDGELITSLDNTIFENKFPNSNHRWTRLTVSKGKHYLTCDTGGFSGVAFGYGYADSYAVTLGSSLNNPFSGDSISPVIAIDEYCSEISGTISEVVDDSSSGILFVYMSDRSYNYSCDIQPKFFNDVDEVIFKAKPIDDLKNAKLIIEYRDMNGNGNKYEYFHNGVSFSTKDTINFRVVDKGDSVCYQITAESFGNVPVILDSVKLSDTLDSRLYFFEHKTPPMVLQNGEDYQFDLCFVPNTRFDKLNKKIYYYFDCGRYDSTIVIGSVKFPELAVLGYDFGNVCLGEQKDGEIKIFNNGNVAVDIEQLDDIIVDNQFYIDTLEVNNSIFPQTILPEDSLSIPVLFVPLSKGNFNHTSLAKNSLNLPNEIILTGNGINSDVKSIEIDWGKRRIGTINDTLVYLKNFGDCNADISFNKFDDLNIYFNANEIEGIKDTILIQDSLAIITGYNPEETIVSNLKAEFTIDTPLQEIVFIDFIGEGTLPVIEPIRVDFDTVPIFSTVDTIAYIIFNSGNEKLWLNYKQTIGDDSCFSVNKGDLSVLQDVFLDSADALSVPISFHPLKLGYNEIAVVINHDAFPAYRRGDTVVIISGVAVPADTNNPEIKFEDDLKYLPCNDNVFKIQLLNSGNILLSLDTLEIISTDVSANWNVLPPLPIEMAPGEFYDFELTIQPRADLNGVIQFKAVFNDTILFYSDPVSIENKMYPIIVNNPGKVEYTIGEEGILSIDGIFPHASDIPVGFKFEIDLDANYLYLLDSKSELYVIYQNDTVSYPMSLSQSFSKVWGQVDEEIIVNDSCQWAMNLNFLALLANSRTTSLDMKVFSDLCYSPGNLSINPSFVGVCLFDIRKVNFTDTSNMQLFISPNPVEEELCIKINLLQDYSLNLSIFDQNGKKNVLCENLNLKKGLHSLIFEISPMASGIYMLSAMTENGVENIMFIINK